MTAQTQIADPYSDAKEHAERAEEMLERRRGELIAAVVATEAGTLPAEIETAAERFIEAEDAAEDARARCLEARTSRITDDERAAHVGFARVSALVAVHVMGWKVARDGSASRPWRVVEPSGKRRELPNFAGDVGAIARAERMLEGKPEARARYGEHMAELFACDYHQIATANPYARASALLHAFGVRSAFAEPPTVA